MRNVMRLIFGIMFSFVLCISVKAQTDPYPANPMDPAIPANPAYPVNPAYPANPVNPANTPAPDDIICLQTDANVFECSVNDPNFREGEMMEDFQIIDEYNEVDINNNDLDQNYYLDNSDDGSIIIEDDQTIQEDQMLEDGPMPGLDVEEDKYIEDNNDVNENEYQNFENESGENEIIEQSTVETTALR